MKKYAAIDLHSNNSYCGVSDNTDSFISKRRVPNDIKEIEQFFMPFKNEISEIVIESTYNTYWLIDGLMQKGFLVKLANPTAMKQYDGLKHTDDESDTLWLNTMNRLGILPEGHIYPKEERPIRDLLRKRRTIINARIQLSNSIQNQFASWKAMKISKTELCKLSEDDLNQIFENKFLVTSGQSFIHIISCMNAEVKNIEAQILGEVKEDPLFNRLMLLPGIGKILAMTIKYETGDIARFPSDKNYLSYARCVKSVNISNNKLKGKGNSRNGNSFLRWAFGEAVIGALHVPEIKKYHDRLVRKKGLVKAKAIMASKIARVAYKTMKDPAFIFDKNKFFI